MRGVRRAAGITRLRALERPPETTAEIAYSVEGAAAPGGVARAPAPRWSEPGRAASPWRLALARLRRDRVPLAFGVLFALLVALSLAAPLWASYIADTGPYENHLSDTIEEGGEKVNVVGSDGIPIGPTWRGQFFLGADDNGRDIMVRLLYGGRNSLFIGFTAALGTTLLAVLVGLVSGYFRGWPDGILSRLMDILWAYPVILLGIALGTALALGGIQIGPLTISGRSLAIPIGIISIIYVPYLSRPIRGQVLSLREKEFVEAARAEGVGPWRIMFGEILPNISSTVLVFFPLIVASAILTESELSFLGAGVQPPTPSWGAMISDGVRRIVTAPYEVIAPGAMLVLTLLSLNVFGDGLRDALDPQARLRVKR